MSRALAAYDPCGCCAAISVLGGRETAWAYEMAARETRAGRRVVEVDVDAWKAEPWHCADHPDGPPWWQSNGGNGRVPAEYVPNMSLGL